MARMLALKTAALLVLMVTVLYLTVRARRFNFDRFRSTHARRKYRVPVEEAAGSSPDAEDGRSPGQ